MKRKIKFLIITFIIICGIYITKSTNLRYLSEVNIDGNINIAVPQIEIDTTNCADSVSIFPGDSLTYEFSIKNYKDSKINEILMQYYINVDVAQSNIPLTYEIYEISGTKENQLSQDTEGFGPLVLNYGAEQEQTYKIVFTWDESDNNVSYMNQQFAFKINASTSQIYKQTRTSEEMTIFPREYSDLTATISAVTGEDNTFKVTVSNPNPYEVKYKIIDSADSYKVEYEGTTDAYATIAANSTETITVIFSGRDDVVYEDMESDSNGNLYKRITIVLDAINPYNADDLQLATNQIIYLQKSIKNNIIADAGEITHYNEGFTFSGVSSSSEAALCSIEDPVSGETMYFYRGNVTNNYVSFAGYTWRILRINSDGSLRIILDSVATTTNYQTANVPSTYDIDTVKNLLSWKNSLAYQALQTWYNQNIATNYSDKVIKSQYVFDTSYSDEIDSTEGGGACIYFGPYLRVGSDANVFAPTFSYTEDSLIEDYVGLITADELLYAGAYFKTDNRSYFLYNSSITQDCWTMSPSFWDNQSHYKAGMFAFSSTGRLHDWPDGGNTLTGTLGLRPVISIRGDIEMSGNGTSSNPYKY